MSDSLRATHALTLAVLRANPRALRSFLDGAGTSVSLVNSLLRVPARTEAAFRDKLERVLQEVMSLGSEAQALKLGAVADCVRRFEQALTGLRQRAVLTGDDFLPLAVRLDELFTQIAAARSLDEQRGTVNPSPTRRNAVLSDALLQQGAATPAAPLAPAQVTERALQSLATCVAADTGRDIKLVIMGIEHVPAGYRKSVDNMLVHLVRNAIEHGIEPVAQRLDLGKPGQGTVSVEFSAPAHDGGAYELMIQDDGQGFDIERIGRVAVENGLLTSESLATLDPRKLVGLIFRPGFSTAGLGNRPGGSSGRGLGMEFLRELVTRLEGNITVSTKRGRYTRFRVTLPTLPQSDHARVA